MIAPLHVGAQAVGDQGVMAFEFVPGRQVERRDAVQFAVGDLVGRARIEDDRGCRGDGRAAAQPVP